ncbi:MAG: oligosaccharide flippase family protein [Patescibacteria group bacterium]|jgi:O-antigen/teichoic acid export membrane protein
MRFYNYFSKTRALLFSRTAKDSAIALGGSGISSALRFLFIFLIARRIGPAQFGIYSTLIGYTTFLASILDLGVSQSLVRFVNEAKNEKDRKSWISTSLFTVILTTLSLGLIATFIYRGFLRNLWDHTGSYSSLVFLITVTVAINIFFLNLLQALQKFWRRSVLDVSFSLVRLGIIVAVFLFGTVTLEWSLFSVVFAYVTALVVAGLLTRGSFSVSLIDKRKVSQVLAFSQWLAGASIFSNLYGRLDILMLAWLSNAYTTGVYSAAARFTMIFPLIVSSLSAVVAPRFASFRSAIDLKSYFRKTIGISVLLSLGMMLLFFLARPLILLAFSERYSEAIPVFRFLVLGNIPFVLSIPAGNAIVYFFKRPQYVTVITFLQVIGLFTLNMFLIPIREAFGPAYSLLLINTAGMVMLYGTYVFLSTKSK